MIQLNNYILQYYYIIILYKNYKQRNKYIQFIFDIYIEKVVNLR